MALTKEYLAECFEYDATTGDLIWKERPRDHFNTDAVHKMWNTRFSGTHAGSRSEKGYLRVLIDMRAYMAHRIIWLLVYATWPRDQIDHKDGDRANNKLDNLREASPSENQRNRKKDSYTTGEYKGVRQLRSGRFIARIVVDGRRLCSGTFLYQEEAHNWYTKMAGEHFGEFANNGVKETIPAIAGEETPCSMASAGPQGGARQDESAK